MSCVRCGKTGDLGIHIFRGGENRRKMLELVMKQKVTLCDVPATDKEMGVWMLNEHGEFVQVETEPTHQQLEDDATRLLEKVMPVDQ